MFIDNKYTKTYFKIVHKYKNSKQTGYSEVHHIVPKSLGGTNKADNLVRLSAKAHFVCHHLLTKMLTGENKSKMIFAFWRMIHSQQQTQKITAKVYEIVRAELSSIMQQRAGENNYFYGKKHTEETKQKMREKAVGRNPHEHRIKPYVSWNTGMTKEDNEGVARISEAKKGIKNPMYGKKGALHPNSYTIELYDNEDILLETFHSVISLENYCRENNLPFNGLYKSFKNNIPYLDGSKNHRYARFNGWYTRRIR